MNNYITRIHLKIKDSPREKLIDYCLASEKQCLAIGWSGFYENNEIADYDQYYKCCNESYKKSKERMNPVLNVFKNVTADDLFWTRDLDGFYWICRAKDSAKAKYVEEYKIGAVIYVEAYKVGMEVPGQIKASFNRPSGGTSERISNEKIVEYSKYIYNKCSGKNYYDFKIINGNIIDNLSDFDLEELVVSYIQLKHNYYVLSNSIAKKSTTIKIECEFMSRDKNCLSKAVVQVKAKQGRIKASEYRKFSEAGYTVFLYCENTEIDGEYENFVYITKEELNSFYYEYKNMLPESITKWEELIK